MLLAGILEELKQVDARVMTIMGIGGSSSLGGGLAQGTLSSLTLQEHQLFCLGMKRPSSLGTSVSKVLWLTWTVLASGTSPLLTQWLGTWKGQPWAWTESGHGVRKRSPFARRDNGETKRSNVHYDTNNEYIFNSKLKETLGDFNSQNRTCGNTIAANLWKNEVNSMQGLHLIL